MKIIRLLGIYLLLILLLVIHVELFAQRTSDPIIVEADSVETEFIGYSKLDKIPLVYSTQNLDAAKSTGTNHLWTGGNLNLNLTGENKVVGIWDGGAVRLTHQELIGRVIQVDGATNLSNHATHVAGTMAAAGVYSSAKGMAFQVDIDAYKWNNDEAEMITAAFNGLLISNHSYGFITGWYYNPSDGIWYWYGNVDISPMEDYKFGFYSPQAKKWDEIAYDAPHYLIVKSAGNDRNDNGPLVGTQHKYLSGSNWVWSNANREKDGGVDGFDCISHAGVAKNVLTVGAVYDIPNGYSQASDVIMSSFSSWGKTDDGRIKPDIVANGIALLSPVATGDNKYANLSGTSMSSPNVSGSLILLQEHHENLYTSNMKAATLKALVIHTADEAGVAEGPDYQFGWGLMNTAKAATVISNNELPTDTLIETQLQNNGVYNLTINSDGTSPFVATLSWTDVPGTVPPVSLNPTTLMLVNDLDMCLTHTATGETFHPYILNPSNPDAAATTGDNFRDNVEKIYLVAPTAGEYTLTISHKDTLIDGNQNFSLILSGMNAPPCVITANFDYSVNDLTVDFSDLSIGADTYSWNFGNGNSGTEANPSHTFAENGTYNVCLTVSNGCGNDTKCMDVVISNPCEEDFTEEWQQIYGGSSEDYLEHIELTNDGGYILGGYSYSGISGNKTVQGYGQQDYWIIKIDGLGNKQWEKSFGGSGGDRLWEIVSTNDGGYILGGESNSEISGNKTSQGYGNFDYWIVKIDALGNKEWEKSYGGSAIERLSEIISTNDGGYILGGDSSSGISGNKTSQGYGVYDYWIIKIDALGNKQWEGSFGGNNTDRLWEVVSTSDGGYILGGASASEISGNKTAEGYGQHDYWIVKVDGLGNKQWEKSFGGSSADRLFGIKSTNDGGYILGGDSDSGISGSKTSQGYGGYDYWIIKIDALGNKQWEKSYGGSAPDTPYDIASTNDGGYILGGWTSSGISGNKTSQGYGGGDYWVVEVDNLGNKQWEKSYGGSGHDSLRHIALTNDGGYILVGYSSSGISGNKISTSYGSNDYWIVKLQQNGPSPSFDSPTPICSSHATTFTNTSQNASSYEWFIDNVGISTNTDLTHTFLSSGTYTIRLEATEGVCTKSYQENIEVLPIPTANFTYTVNGLTVDFSTEYMEEGIVYNWDFGDGNSSSEQNLKHTYISDGTYNVCLAESNVCGNETKCEDVVIINPCEEEVIEEWQKSYGGNGHDYLKSMVLTSDGGHILGGSSDSGISGNKTSQGYGNRDYWIVKINDLGNKQWEKSFGGSGFENLSEIVPTSDGGYILGGISGSGISGNKTSQGYGGEDYWIVKIDGLGSKQWEKSFGGSSHDFLRDLVLTSDGGYILGGHSISGVDGNKTSSNYGSSDYWIIKIDGLGNKQWEKSFGGSKNDSLYDILLANDGGYVLGGYSDSGIDGNKTSQGYGNGDYWIIKIDALGNEQWEKSFGGSSGDVLQDMVLTSDGGYILGGYSDSGIGGNKTSQGYGDWDYWIIKIDDLGNKQWEKSFGGSGLDTLYDISLTSDGGCVLGGRTASGISGNKTSQGYGIEDYWIIKIDSLGNKQLEKTFGGSSADVLWDLVLTGDGGYILGGYSVSTISGTKTSTDYGGYDYWIIKLQQTGLSASFDSPTPICSSQTTTFINTSQNATSYEWFINGQSVSTDTDLIYTFSQTGIYEIRLTAFSVDCEDTYLKTITVTSNASLLELGSDKIICDEGTSTTLEANISDMAWYFWDKEGANVGATQSIDVSESGTYTLNVADACGNTNLDEIAVLIDDDCVWPGDFNYDGVVNNVDLLALGLAFNTTGSLRSNASLEWEEQACEDWAGIQADGGNYKHTDGNGDGTVNSADHQAIYQNYGSTHDTTAPTIEDNSTSNITLVPVLEDNSASFGTEGGVPVKLNMHLESTNNQDITLYAFAFHINYGNAKLAEEPTIDFTNSWLGTPNNDLLYVVKNRPNLHRVDISITGINHQNRIGQGNFGVLSLIIDDVLPSDDSLQLHIGMVGMELIDNQGIPTPLGGESEDFIIENQDICPDGIVVEYSNSTDLPLLTWVAGEIFVGNLDNTGNVVIGVGEEVELKSGHIIDFQPGTFVEMGAVLTAEIEQCQEGENNPIDGDGSNKKEQDLIVYGEGTEEVEMLIYPNPITDYTHIAYELSKDTEVSLYLLDKTGKVIQSLISPDLQKAGKYKVSFEACAARMPVGVYYVVLETLLGRRMEKLVKTQ